MSHSQFRHIDAYTETCMAWSLRQAYDYWQDQPGLFYMQAHSGISKPAQSVAKSLILKPHAPFHKRIENKSADNTRLGLKSCKLEEVR